MPDSKTISRRADKERLYDLFARIAAALANPHRLELVDLLSQGPRTVEELAREAHLSMANTSQHLQRLKQTGLVTNERKGLYVRYLIADPQVTRLWLELRGVAAQQLPEVDRALNAYRPERREFEQITPEELQTRMSKGKAVLLDVRPRVEYEAGHLPGAQSMPLDELERRMKEIPKSKTVIAYCRGPYCVFADDALHLLSRKGWKVARLEEGVAEWQQAGLALAHE